jgi:predicted DNA-binding transcriptional regulator YafY
MSQQEHKKPNVPMLQRLEDLEKLVKLLQGPNKPSSYEDIARRMKFSLRTAKRNVDFLRQRGYQIDYSRSKGFSCIQAGKELRQVLINHEEALPSIVLMRSMLQAVSKIDAGAGAGDLLSHFCHSLENQGLKIDEIGYYISSTAQAMPQRLVPTFRSLVKGLLEKRKVVIQYKSNKDPKPQERLIHPYHLLENEGRWYCLAFCAKARARRMYALWRIEKAVVSDESFERPAEIDNADYWAAHSEVFGVWVKGGPKVEIVLRMTGYAARLLEESSYRPKAMKVRRPSADPESVRVSFYASAFEDVVPWIMRWGAYCEVVSPPELREIVSTQAKRMLSLYEPSNR